MLLLFTDTHLDDNPDNEYRWEVFKRLHEIIDDYPITCVYNLGDAWDRKDRFSGIFVNRLVTNLREVGRRAPLKILRGNHDRPLNGPAFFEFVNGLIPGVKYVTEPEEDGKLLLLPFTPNPREDWKFDFSKYRAAFLHITVTGAIAENGRAMVGHDPAILPKGLKLYSGDIHNPQEIRNLTYVGCPHPIKFGDEFPCRMLLLDDNTFEVEEVLKLDPPRKRVVDISSIEDLENVEVAAGDQVRIRFALDPSEVEKWGAIEGRLAEWAAEAGVKVSSIEGVVEGTSSGRTADLDTAPETLLQEFAKEEGISKDLLAVGLELLKE